MYNKYYGSKRVTVILIITIYIDTKVPYHSESISIKNQYV